MKTNGVYISFWANTGGNFLSNIVDKIRNPNAECITDPLTGHAHISHTRMIGVSNSFDDKNKDE